MNLRTIEVQLKSNIVEFQQTQSSSIYDTLLSASLMIQPQALDNVLGQIPILLPFGIYHQGYLQYTLK